MGMGGRRPARGRAIRPVSPLRRTGVHSVGGARRLRSRLAPVIADRIRDAGMRHRESEGARRVTTPATRSPGERTPRGSRLPRRARRAQLLESALEVFVAQGYHAAAMDDIA